VIKMLPIADAVARTSHMAETRKSIEEWEYQIGAERRQTEEDVGIMSTIGEDVAQFLRRYYKKFERQAASE